jgi:hypothetical protein
MTKTAADVQGVKTTRKAAVVEPKETNMRNEHGPQVHVL